MDEGGEEPRRNESSPHVPIVRFAPGGRGAMFVRVGFVETSDGECSGVREPPYPTCVVCQRDRGEHYAGMGMAIAILAQWEWSRPKHTNTIAAVHIDWLLSGRCVLCACWCHANRAGPFSRSSSSLTTVAPYLVSPLFLFFFVSTPLYATGVGWMGWIGQSVAAVTAPAVRLVVSSCA